MAAIEVEYTGDARQPEIVDYDVCSGVESDIVDYLEENGYDDWEIVGFDDDYPDPSCCDDLDAYADLVEKIDEHGEGYRMRWEDVGDFDWDDSYEGCWACPEEWAQNLVEDCYGLDLPPFVAIDWEMTARDLMMDYSVYEGDDGYWFFRD